MAKLYSDTFVKKVAQGTGIGPSPYFVKTLFQWIRIDAGNIQKSSKKIGWKMNKFSYFCILLFVKKNYSKKFPKLSCVMESDFGNIQKKCIC